MENNEEMTKVEKNTQKILNKLISEEKIAGELYLGAIYSVQRDQVGVIAEKFDEIAVDELDDHMKELVKFAMQNGFEVPCKNKDIEKHASKKMVSKFNNMKKGQDALYYIQLGIDSEVEAIKSYEECMAQEYLFELQPLLLKIYYEEIQHLEDLNLLLQCAAMGVDLK